MTTAALEEVATRAHASLRAGMVAKELLEHGEEGSVESTRASLPFVETTIEESRRIVGVLQREGYTPTDLPQPNPIRLSDLDTPDTRRLLALLEESWATAERVDAQRGRLMPERVKIGPGESRGTDLAEAVSDLVNRLRLEIFGPKGKE